MNPIRKTLPGVALALSLASCGVVPAQTGAVPLDVQPITQCPVVEAGGRPMSVDGNHIEMIVATTLLEDSKIC